MEGRLIHETDHFADKILVFTMLCEELDEKLPVFQASIEAHAAPLKLLTQKREDMLSLLREGHNASKLPTNMKKHKADVKLAYEKSLLKYKEALQASPIKLEKQIQHEIRFFTQHLNSMLAPHWNICRTLKRANAETSRDETLTAHERQLVDDFLEEILRLNDEIGDFCSVAMTKEAFLEQVSAFEKAAANDLFVVCMVSLKLNFCEPLDQPLFGAYCEDLKSRMKELHTLRNSNKFQAAVANCDATRVEVSVCYHKMQQLENNGNLHEETKQETLACLKKDIQTLAAADGLVI
ncbi:unnamed protein product [Aphanomyces euteiches]